MELEELKQAWSKYDNNLKKNLMINQEILRNMKLDKSKREMRKPLISEIMSLVIIVLFMPFVVGFTINYISELKFSISGIIGLSVGVVYLISAIKKINRFVRMDYYKSPIITLQKNLNELRTCILRLRKVELYLMPILIVAILPIAFKGIHDIDIFANFKLFILEIVFCLGLCYVITYWINKHLYDNKIKDVKSFLDEIANFEKEE